MPYIVGLTGGIGSGKTTVADKLRQLGANVIDADAIAHELSAPGRKGFEKIVQRFGSDYLRGDGSLDRAKLRNLVFSIPQAKLDLEAILHPLIREEVERRIAYNKASYILLVVPLLFETNAYADLIDRSLVVDCDEQIQIFRAQLRSKLSADEVRKIMSTQLGRKERKRRADDILTNDSDLPSLDKIILSLHQQYLALASENQAKR